MSYIKNILAFEEGFSDVPYWCSEGFVTIGFGTKLHRTRWLDPKDFTLRVDRDSAWALLERDLTQVTLQLNCSEIKNCMNY